MSAQPTALPADLVEAIDSAVDADTTRLTDIFVDLHRHPELGFHETRTSGIVIDQLTSLGFEVHTGIAQTGVAAILRNGDGPTVAYRADMDALPIEEKTGLPYASTATTTSDDGKTVPVGHMCGHDAHVTWMLGLAKLLVDLRESWSGTAILVGQPAEEPIEGARAMVADGLYDQIPVPDDLVALHTMPAPVGYVLAVPGTRMAGTDQIDIQFHGVGAHGSMPEAGKDPVLMAAEAIVGYQSIVSRMISPSATAVLTVGAVHAGNANNAIPDSALVKANIRWFDAGVRTTMIDGIKRISDSAATAAGMPADRLPEYTMKGSSTPLVNNDALVTQLGADLASLLDEQHVITAAPPVNGSEDCHELVGPHESIRVGYLLVGVASEKVFTDASEHGTPVPSPHSPFYAVDLAAIPFGTRVAAYLMFDLLGVRR
ncbi:amidohydrolase [Gordonia sp. TBRC 11910]|uniref:Amidohydrolase n=1 Tax=Gordonia asplenii TaxID=2725283 RepID=A0A848KSN5_9ACTN|nr:amidohydrolase [Gordonia asplenii]NMO01964.1 amidohydrolase [Gordonia asplenii]